MKLTSKKKMRLTQLRWLPDGLDKRGMKSRLVKIIVPDGKTRGGNQGWLIFL